MDASPSSLPEVRLQQQPTERERLLPWRYALVGVGALHTLLCAGVVFGWSSLEAVLRAEGRWLEDECDAALRRAPTEHALLPGQVVLTEC